MEGSLSADADNSDHEDSGSEDIDDSEDEREATANRLIDRIPGAWATLVLAAVLVLNHIAVGLVPYTRGRAEWWEVLISRRGPRLLARCGAMRTRAVDNGQFYRLVSATFLHADALHLLLNTVSLVVVGRVVEAVFGRVRMLWVFLISAMSGATASWLIGRTDASVGASGGVFGLLGAIVIFGWRHRHELPDDIGRVFRRRVAVIAVANLALGIPLRFIDDLAHFGGLVAGLIAGTLLSNEVTPGGRPTRGWTVILAVLSAICVGMAIRGVAENWGL